MEVVASRFDIFLVNLDPTVGSEIKKSRPCVIISPNEMNKYLNTVIIAPMTSVRRGYPTRIVCRFKGKTGEIVLDQIRSIDKARLVRKLGTLNEEIQNQILLTLQEMFSI
jgi:mRNA interferase MazF